MSLASYHGLFQHPRVIEVAQTRYGKVAILFIIFECLMLFSHSWWPGASRLGITWPILVIIILAALSFFPKQKNSILWFAWLASLSLLPWFHWQWLSILHPQHHLTLGFYTTTVLLAFVFSSVYLFCCQRQWIHYPLVNLFIILLVLMFIAPYLTNHRWQIHLWAFIIALAAIIWYLSYSILNRKKIASTKILTQWRYYLPFWGGTTTPFAKGQAYLSKIAASDAKSLACSQLSGIKLMIWTLVLYGILSVINWLRAYYHIPVMLTVFQNIAQHQHYTWQFAWLCLISHFMVQTLTFAINGHLIIALCRVAGFQALRNMYKPFLATSIAEFWNRYYFYFKELLVDVFFYPTYFKCFKTQPRLRMLSATLAAVFFGNILYHLFAKLYMTMHYGLFNAILLMNAYLFYALILAVAIAISQWRIVHHKKPAMSPFAKWRARGMVSGFYIIMSVFSTPFASHNILINFKFIASLFT